jgi:DNA-binding GntR family transcriptional regulator
MPEEPKRPVVTRGRKNCDKLVRELSMSQTPVRKALSMLEAEHRSDDELAAMRELQLEMRSEVAQSGVRPYNIFAPRDGALHELIATASANRFLRNSVTRLHSHVHLFRLYFDSAVIEEALDERDGSSTPSN